MSCANIALDVTLWQRSKTYIMTTKEGMPRLMKSTFLLLEASVVYLTENEYCIDVYWEDGPPTEVADLIDNSMPVLYRKMVHKRIAKDIAEADKYVTHF